MINIRKRYNMKKIDKKILKTCFISTLIFIIIAHGYCYFNLNFSHDSLRVWHWGNYGDSVQLGRFLIPIYILIRGKYYPPLIIGVLSLLFIALSVYLTVDLLKLKNKASTFLISGVYTTCSTITLLNATYINYTDMYCLSILLYILGVYILFKTKKLYRFLSIIPFVCATGIYQSYIGIPIGLSIIIIINKLINNKTTKEAIIDGIIAIASILISLLLYSALYKFILNAMNLTATDSYNGMVGVGQYGSLENIKYFFNETYKRFFDYFINPPIFHKTIIKITNIILLIIAIIQTAIKIILKKVNVKNILLIIILYSVLPFALNIICFISKGFEHTLTVFAINLGYILFISLNSIKTDSKIDEKLYFCTVILIGIFICCNILYSNQSYLKKQLEFDNTLTTMNRIVMRIEEVDNYEMGVTPVLFLGDINSGPLSMKRNDFDYNAVGMFGNFSITYYSTYRMYFDNYLAYPINIADESIIEKNNLEKEIVSMTCFPAKNSIKMINGVVVVKLS